MTKMTAPSQFDPNGPLDNSGDEPLSNFSRNPSFAAILSERQRQRRQLLKGGLGVTLAAFLGGALMACGREPEQSASNQNETEPQRQNDATLLGFATIATSRADHISLPAGYSARAFVPWGTPINGLEPAFKTDASNTGAEQEQQVGSHHDGMHFFPIDERSAEGLLVINHEYVDPTLLHTQGPTLGETRPTDQVRKEIAGHGVSVLHIARAAEGNWNQVVNSRFNRRITGTTPMEIKGPARGAHKLVTAYSPEGNQGRGTLNNCAHGVTPWNTYIAAEENWAGYFINQDSELPREHRRYGVNGNDGRYRWHTAESGEDVYRRFDASSRADDAPGDYRNEPNNFGWLTEIDPFAPDSVPQKRTALGRFAHEGVIFAPAEEGEPVVCYSGDDSQNEYIYKFVSAERYQAATASGALLDKGTLSVASFNADGSGDWLPLSLDDAGFVEKARQQGVKFADQADLLINTRLAADVAGATKMDRPEWGAINPETRRVYFTLTNNTRRTEETVDAANPRANNKTGHIIRWREASDDFSASSFEWDIFVMGGDVGTHAPGEDAITLTEDNHFASPDGLWFDPRGVLWIQTDMSGAQLREGPFGNNQMLAADPQSGALRRFLVGPVGCEITGAVSTPDLKTLFVNIQHPGEGSGPTDFSSHWPGGGESRPRSSTLIVTKDDGGKIGT